MSFIIFQAQNWPHLLILMGRSWSRLRELSSRVYAQTYHLVQDFKSQQTLFQNITTASIHQGLSLWECLKIILGVTPLAARYSAVPLQIPKNCSWAFFQTSVFFSSCISRFPLCCCPGKQFWLTVPNDFPKIPTVLRELSTVGTQCLSHSVEIDWELFLPFMNSQNWHDLSC